MSKFKIKVIDVIDQPDGSALVNLDINQHTKNLIKESYGWKRWDAKKFQKLFIDGLMNLVSKVENKND
jgi:hypothetical protein